MSAGKGDRNRSDPVRYWRATYWMKQEEAKRLADERAALAKKNTIPTKHCNKPTGKGK